MNKHVFITHMYAKITNESECAGAGHTYDRQAWTE